MAKIHMTRRSIKTRAFTLVELLVVIVILAILSSMVLMALGNTQASARDARTRGTIAKLDTLIMAKWETYQTRRVPLQLSDADKKSNRTQHARWRLYALRDIMRMELPDRHSDYQNPPADTTNTKLSPKPLALALAYQKRASSHKSHAEYTTNETAECLYLIVAFGLRDADAISQFSEAEIGDTDQDGMPEFLDGWGEPIQFLRWAPGYSKSTDEPWRIQINDPQNHHDPFDPMKIDNAAFALYPLIFSKGPDKSSDINAGSGTSPRSPAYSPYTGTPLIGNTAKDISEDKTVENWHDNITNHELQAN